MFLSHSFLFSGVIYCNIFQLHTLPTLDQIYAISEVSIIKNYQYQHKKQFQQTIGLIQRLVNNTHLSSIGLFVAEKFCLRKCFYLLFASFSLAWKTIFCQTEKENRVKQS